MFTTQLKTFWTAGYLLLCVTASLFSQTADSFNPSSYFRGPPAHGLAFEPDGHILVVGSSVLRLNSTGSLDPTFNVLLQGTSYCVALQKDGKILTAGSILSLSGVPRDDIGRLNPDGTLDTAFNPGAKGNWVNCLLVQRDGKILVGGIFTNLAGQPWRYLGRLNPDGSPDASFQSLVDGSVECMALQPDGKILVGGFFSKLGGQAHPYLGRLNSDGSADSSYNPAPDRPAVCMALETDGSVIIGGNFFSVSGVTRYALARISPTGSLDASYGPGGWSGDVYSLALQANGKLLVACNSYALQGKKLARLLPNGALDTSFDAKLNYQGGVSIAALQADGKIMAVGTFSSIGGESRTNVARLNNNDPTIENLTYSGSKISWQRGGACPEVAYTTFETSTNGLEWTAIGEGTRVSGGWEFNGFSLPAKGYIRARGFLAGGGKQSSWYCESVISPACIITSPIGQTNRVGTNVTFSAEASGSLPLSYQWCFNDVAIPGATNSTLLITNAQPAHSGNYTIVASNLVNSVTSQVAVLNIVVVPAAILSQPQSATNLLGASAQFGLQPDGTPPLSIQWYRNGAPIVSATGSNLAINPIGLSDFAGYQAVVSNAWGAATSSVVTLVQAFSPTIVVEPAGATGLEGAVITLTVQASGTAPLRYQWQRDGLNLGNTGKISGATSSALSLTNLDLSMQGDYRVIVSNAFGQTNSPAARLTVLAPPRITTQPISITTNPASAVRFEITATGSAPLLYQWRRNGVPLKNDGRVSGATAPALLLAETSFDDTANYAVVVSNSVGCATSSVARLLITSPSVLYQTSFEATEGFQLGSPLAGQGGWTSGGGGNSANGIKLEAIPACGQQGFISGAAASAEASFLRLWRPLNTTLPDNAVVEFSTLMRIEDSTNNAYDNFLWLVDDSSGNTYFQLTFDNSDYSIAAYHGEWSASSLKFENGKTYRLKILLDFGRERGSAWLDDQIIVSDVVLQKKFSGLDRISPYWGANDDKNPGNNFMAFDDYRVSVVQKPVIQTQPQDLKLLPGNNGQLKVEAFGYGPLTYQWWLGSTLLTGATNAQLDLKNVSSAQAGDYRVVVANSYASITSAAAQVRVISSGLLYQTHFEASEGFEAALPLAGQAGWLAETENSSGIVEEVFPGFGQQAFVGWNQADEGSFPTLPFAFTSIPSNVVLHFSALIQITDSANGIYNEFQWRFYSPNASFNIDLVNNDYSIYYYANGWHLAPLTFENAVTYQLDVELNGAERSGSAWLSGKPIAIDAPLASAGAKGGALGLTSLSVGWFSSGGIGENRMYFDDITVEAVQGPCIISQPNNYVAQTGIPATFQVQAIGVNPMGYQWKKGSIVLTNSSHISGAKSASLTINGVTSTDAGTYSVSVTNAYGETNSASATLQVYDVQRPSLGLRLNSQGKLAITIPGEAGVGYVIEYKNTLSPNEAWKTLRMLDGYGKAIDVSDATFTNSATRYYRLRLQ